jgi:hypothetical protein
MTILPIKSNTPHIAKPSEQQPMQAGYDERTYGVFDLWLKPDKYRSIDRSRFSGTSGSHSLDTLA